MMSDRVFQHRLQKTKDEWAVLMNKTDKTEDEILHMEYLRRLIMKFV